jgi:hypothetical protein
VNGAQVPGTVLMLVASTRAELHHRFVPAHKGDCVNVVLPGKFFPYQQF